MPFMMPLSWMRARRVSPSHLSRFFKMFRYVMNLLFFSFPGLLIDSQTHRQPILKIQGISADAVNGDTWNETLHKVRHLFVLGVVYKPFWMLKMT